MQSNQCIQLISTTHAISQKSPQKSSPKHSSGRLLVARTQRGQRAVPFHYKIVMKSLKNHYKIVMKSLKNHYKIIMKSLKNHYKIIMKSLKNHHI